MSSELFSYGANLVIINEICALKFCLSAGCDDFERHGVRRGAGERTAPSTFVKLDRECCKAPSVRFIIETKEQTNENFIIQEVMSHANDVPLVR